MPGGVSSPVRAFKSVGGNPVVFDRVKGAYAWDVDGNQYIDYVGTWGPAICGHAHDEVFHLHPSTFLLDSTTCFFYSCVPKASFSLISSQCCFPTGFIVLCQVLDSVRETMVKGTSFGAPCELENVLAKKVIEAVPSVEMVRFTNSGTEACMGMLRMVRAYTKKEKVCWNPRILLTVYVNLCQCFCA